MIEVAVVAGLYLSGWLLLAALGLRGWGIVPLSFITGSALAIVIGFLLVVTRLPTYPWAIIAGTLLGPGALFLLATRRVGFRSMPFVHLGAGAAIVVPLVAAFRDAHLVKYHIDSFRYLVGSGLLADGLYGHASLNLVDKRMLSAPIIHSLARLGDEWYLRSHSPLLTLAVLGFLCWALARWHGGPVRDGRLVLIGGLAVLLFVTNNRMIWNAFYVNDHLVFGASFLVACTASWMIARRSREFPSLMAALVLALGTLVVTRPEGFIAGLFAVLPLLLSSETSYRVRMGALAALALAMVLWFGYATLARFQALGSFEASSFGPLAAGALLLAVIPIMRWGWPERHRGTLLLVLEAGLWASLAFFAIRDPGVLLHSLRATYHNVVLGAGSWGYSLVLLGVMGLVALVLAREPSLIHLRFPLTAMVPTLFLLAYLRDGAYRVGVTDSLNRMLMQVVPLLVLYIAAVALSHTERRELPVSGGAER